MKNKVLSTLFMMLFTQLIFAQTGIIRGFVYDKSTGEPIIFTNVYLKGTNFGSQTDVNGFYSITKVPVGDYTLISSYIGYDTTTINISLKNNEILNQKIFLTDKQVELGAVEILAKKEEQKTEVRTSVVSITPKQLQKIPTVGGEPDLAQYLQILPGVVSTGDQGGQLYIRGGSPIQTKVLLDGMTIYNPFHSLGLFSVFETDIIRNVDVYTGGFNADFSGRISAVIDIATRDGNKKKISGKLSTNSFLSHALLEGPIKKLDDLNNGTSCSYILTAKTSYLDKSSKLLYSYIDTAGLPYTFTDFYGKIALNTENGSKISLSGFYNTDEANFKNTANFGWDSYGINTNFVLVPGQAKQIIEGFFNYSTYKIGLKEEQSLNNSDATIVDPAKQPRNSSIGGFNGGINFSYYMPLSTIKYGLEFSGYSTEFSFTNPFGVKIEENQYTTEIGSFFKYKIGNKKLILEPGVHVNYYASATAFAVEPRIGIKYNINNAFRIKGSAGLYTQSFISTKSDRDVVNLFTGFLTTPEGTLKNYNGKTLDNNLQKAAHAVAGFEADLSKNLDLNVEGYYKKFTQQININRNKESANDPNYIVEDGDAYGFDVLLKYDYKRTYFWAVYSLGYVTRNDGEQIYPPHFDRRHNINLVASYELGKKHDWEISARWNIGSGFPFTKTKGFFEQISLNNGIDADYNTQNGNLGIIYDQKINSGRLPYYHRLDLSVKKRINIAATKLEINLSTTNVYDRDNIFYFDRISFKKIHQLPVLPSLGITWQF